MTLRTTARRAAAVAVLDGAVLALRVVAWRPLSLPATDVPDRFVPVSGVAHSHTSYPDGGGTIRVVEAIVFLVDTGAVPPDTDGVI